MGSHRDIRYMKLLVELTERAYGEFPEAFVAQLRELREELKQLESQKKKKR